MKHKKTNKLMAVKVCLLVLSHRTWGPLASGFA